MAPSGKSADNPKLVLGFHSPYELKCINDLILKEIFQKWENRASLEFESRPAKHNIQWSSALNHSATVNCGLEGREILGFVKSPTVKSGRRGWVSSASDSYARGRGFGSPYSNTLRYVIDHAIGSLLPAFYWGLMDVSLPDGKCMLTIWIHPRVDGVLSLGLKFLVKRN